MYMVEFVLGRIADEVPEASSTVTVSRCHALFHRLEWRHERLISADEAAGTPGGTKANSLSSLNIWSHRETGRTREVNTREVQAEVKITASEFEQMELLTVAFFFGGFFGQLAVIVVRLRALLIFTGQLLSCIDPLVGGGAIAQIMESLRADF
ncbi:hypothetical protein R1sor_014930 [Riccia sorocarpa]|uniref:Uncharacterized protein n=1 Tax=Riccia sorocarpa TaxID=122646 RepID=A0ABD3HCM8_9MARC